MKRSQKNRRARRLRVESLESRHLMAVVFEFSFNDTDGTGFNAAGATGQERREALQTAGQVFGTTALSEYDATIQIAVLGNAPPLASAGSNFAGNPTGGGFGRTNVIRNKILSNGATDLNGSESDGSVSWNFDQTTWEYDLNTTPSSDEFDFYSTLYHELTHAMGWSHGIGDNSQPSWNGQDAFGDGVRASDGGQDRPGEWTAYDRWLSDANGTRVIDESALLLNSLSNWNTLQVGGASPAGGLFFDGPNAKAANGGNPVGLYTPNPIQSGSSISHLDDDNNAYSGMIMLAAAGAGPSARTFTDIELGILKDIGFTEIQQIGSAPAGGGDGGTGSGGGSTGSSKLDTIGLYQGDASLFHLKNSFTAGASDEYFSFGPAGGGWTPLAGDWNGDATDTIGLYQPDAALFHLKDTFSAGASDQYFSFGPIDSGWIPLSGDWNGDGTDTIGLYQPDNSIFHLKDSFTAGASDHFFAFGPSGSAGWLPVVGDWDGNGSDSIGLYQPDASLFHLKNSLASGSADVFFAFGPASGGWTPISGDWNGDGTDTIGLYQPDISLFHLKDSFTAGASDQYFAFGPGNNAGWIPLTGDWNGPNSSSSNRTRKEFVAPIDAKKNTETERAIPSEPMILARTEKLVSVSDVHVTETPPQAPNQPTRHGDKSEVELLLLDEVFAEWTSRG